MITGTQEAQAVLVGHGGVAPEANVIAGIRHTFLRIQLNVPFPISSGACVCKPVPLHALEPTFVEGLGKHLLKFKPSFFGHILRWKNNDWKFRVHRMASNQRTADREHENRLLFVARSLIAMKEYW
jgi:hypothetical protein